MIHKFIEEDGTETIVKIIGLKAHDKDAIDYLDLYKNIAKNPTLKGFLGYLEARGMLVEIIEPFTINFPND